MPAGSRVRGTGAPAQAAQIMREMRRHRNRAVQRASPTRSRPHRWQDCEALLGRPGVFPFCPRPHPFATRWYVVTFVFVSMRPCTRLGDKGSFRKANRHCGRYDEEDSAILHDAGPSNSGSADVSTFRRQRLTIRSIPHSVVARLGGAVAARHQMVPLTAPFRNLRPTVFCTSVNFR